MLLYIIFCLLYEIQPSLFILLGIRVLFSFVLDAEKRVDLMRLTNLIGLFIYFTNFIV